MTFPINNNIKLSKTISNYENGQLPSEALVPCGITNTYTSNPTDQFVMSSVAARCMKAFLSKCPFDVRATGTYRTYLQQVTLFQARYTTTKLSGRPTKIWNGVVWYQRPNVAMAAVPGTSNHGYGLAVDFAEELDDDITPESISAKMFEWLCVNGPKYGFYGSTTSEKWHWQYVLGDGIPQIVLEYENGPVGPNDPEFNLNPRFVRQKGFTNVFYIEGASVLALSGEIMASYLQEDPSIKKIFQDHIPSFRAYTEASGLKMSDWETGGDMDSFE